LSEVEERSALHAVESVAAMKRPPKKFKASLERSGSRLAWIIVHIPFDVHKTWGTRGLCKVRGEINGFPFRTSLFPTGRGEHILMVNKKMQAGGKAYAGSVAQFRMEPDFEERVVTVPKELKRILAEERALQRWFEKLNYSTRKWVCDRVSDVKSTDARLRRSEQVAEQLMCTMEAEEELPPLLRRAFSGHAFEGWQRMSLLRRRGCLLAIFYSRNPEARARRLAKVVEETEGLAEKVRSKA
jgi:Domain of unknown function (DUF1905)/Bacteriocin-protection, YdeI or OmpD-Associated